jgi:hypothetical protein
VLRLDWPGCQISDSPGAFERVRKIAQRAFAFTEHWWAGQWCFASHVAALAHTTVHPELLLCSYAPWAGLAEQFTAYTYAAQPLRAGDQEARGSWGKRRKGKEKQLHQKTGVVGSEDCFEPL